MPKTYYAIMLVVLVGGLFCTVLSSNTASFTAGLALLVVGAAGLSSGYFTYLDNDDAK